MLSSELADLAGVTVRTLRHYHQIGLLPEPPRSDGDYRQYGIGDLVRVLRITRLTALGIPLSELPAVLDDPTAAGELLNELDRQAAAEIERLSARRASIDVLRRTGALPDLPPELSTWQSAPDPDAPKDMLQYEHEQLILLGHLLDDDGRAGLAALLNASEDSRTTSASLTARFYALDADAPDHEVETLVDDWIAHLRPLLAHTDGLSSLSPRAPALLDQLNEHRLRPVQHRVLRTLQWRLTHSGDTSPVRSRTTRE
ncbi:MerR family transcriptional regulator [Prauserella halophila]|uniref:MerR family transcriptional regulator n=1 Tax=Prauserella halophila TaxID=185641 RepID=A0ABN1W3Z4_9PSEU|nr:MerR family transcriptional regulator [Prauserella halophila]MCP2236431.1 DNA-binding transcriptional regulator, MerR family [Prauserella halophila]